ncbi:MAG: cytochrome c3 family protein [Thermoanaerobaculia bacterium]
MRFIASLAAVVWVSLWGAAQAQLTSSECLDCHSDSSLTKDVGGKTVSVHVDPDKFGASVHGPMDCTDCHSGITDYPHETVESVDCAGCHGVELKGVHGASAGKRAVACADCHGKHEIKPPASVSTIDCSKCHKDVVDAQRRSLHGRAAARGDKLAPTCTFCHGSHAILPHKDLKAKTNVMNVPLLCGGCHREGTAVSQMRDIPQHEILENYVDSIHGVGLYQKGLTVTAVCTSCHTSHEILPHTDPKSSIARKNIAKTCQQCHARIEEVHRKVIDGQLWEKQPHMIPACVDCHEPHKARRVFYDAGMSNRDCLVCHGKKDLTAVKDGKQISLYVDAEKYATSTHAKTACAQCHTGVSPSHTRPCDSITTKPDCAVCHAAQNDQWKRSTHGQLAAKGDKDAPGCLDCHDNHATASKRTPTSPTFARNVPALCARCHRTGEKAAVRIKSDIPDIVQSYADSIHGEGLTKAGLVVSATCVNCHSSHMELPPEDPNSSVNPANLANTCGTCHHGIAETFAKSIHATAKPTPGRKLPTCNDCHTSHQISRTAVSGFRGKMMDQCGKCHQEEAGTFFETFHGKVSQLGSEGAAKCSDCHGKHDILPTDDPKSSLSRANVVATCGQCHEGSHRRFAGYLTHATHHDQDKYPWLFWSFRLMVMLLVGTLAFFFLHTLLWLFRIWRTRHHWRVHREAPEGEVFYARFSRFQRTQHFIMLLAFFTLAITGMALKFSYTGWAQLLSKILGGAHSMGLIHRVAGVVLLAIFVTHIVYLIRRKNAEGWRWIDLVTGPNTLMFTLRDLKEFWGSMKWFLGKGERPQYGRYTYWEKFDYFAVFWGVMVIGSTGIVLWFPEALTRLLPGWSINVATIIHSDEALLAVAFIFTIHFFNTHFRPDKFPMDPVIFTGRVPLEEFKFDKPGEYELMKETGKLEGRLVGPASPKLEKIFRIFGFAALFLGLSLIGLIIYAMVFAYK